MLNKEKIFELADSLKIDNDDFVILSSAALVIRGILENANDLDIAVTKNGLENLSKIFNVIPKENNDTNSKWFIVNDKVECVLDDMENKKQKVGKYYLQDINNYLSYINDSTREKDIKRVELVKKYIEEGL